MTVRKIRNEKNDSTKQIRFSLTVIDEDDIKTIDEFKEICKKQKKRYTSIVLKLFREYIDDYKALR
jgi:hypothetical protein